MANFDDFKLAVEALSGGKNTVILDDIGMPSVMVAWPKQKNSDLFGGSEIIHPGSIVDGNEKTMYVSKFINIVYNNRAYSLPYREPKHTINFDTSVTMCRNKGAGWGLMPFSLWAQIALWAKKNGTMPRGNNNYGKDHSYVHEKGTGMAVDSSNRITRTAVGSGPATWNHNWLPDGIADMNGNVYEWCAGLRLKDGEIQIIPYANSMLSTVSLGSDSTSWKAIDAATGNLVDPGTAGTLKYDYLNSKITLISGTVTDDGSSGRSTGFTSLAAESGLTVPELAEALILYPDSPGGDYGGDNRYVTLAGERLPLCGGDWNDTGSAGVFCVYLINPRASADDNIGFRSAYCDL